jgi:hypothetical protein
VPTVAIVEGVKVQFYAQEHPPPHFHAVFAEYRADRDRFLADPERKVATCEACRCDILGDAKKGCPVEGMGHDAC